MYLKPISTIKAKIGVDPNGPAQAFFTQTCYNHMNKYVPRDTGDLASNVEISSDEITYKSPYAHYQYYGKVMGPNIPIFTKGVKAPVGFYSPKGKPKHYTGKKIKYHTAGTGGRWDKRVVSAEIRQIVKEVQLYVDRYK